VIVSETPIKAVELALLERDGEIIKLQATTQSRVLILTGEPLGEPIVGHGPFVMNTREEIHDAIWDFQSGMMGQLR
jgi:redox-sensitive bicupin YhaK (pirin superfamily)